MKTRLLQAGDIEKIVLTVGLSPLMDGMIQCLKEEIEAYQDAGVQIPARDGLHYENPALGLLEWMPAYVAGKDISIKLVGYHPTNPAQRKIPSVISTIAVFDSRSGHLTGLVAGTFLTALRTGAMSSLASECLALPESRVVGIIGAGAQAVTQVFALSRRFPIHKVLCHDIDPRVAASFKDRIRPANIAVEAVGPSGIEKLVEEADIICTCTSEDPGKGPVLKDYPARPHLHINAVGSDFHGKTELPHSLLKKSVVCPDFTAQAIHEGECQQLDVRDIGPDIVQLLQNREDYLELRLRRTVFDSTGWAFADHVVASMIMREARSAGVGSEVRIECLPTDPKDPFSFMQAADAKHPRMPMAHVSDPG